MPAIVASAERFLAQESQQPGHPPEQTILAFPEAPSQLVRRFYPRQPRPQDGESWIPWAELPDGLFQRVEMADECKRKIYQAQRYDHQTGASSLTAEDVQHIFARERPGLLRAYSYSATDFDLHDVYVCAEATLLEFYTQRDQYPAMSAIDRQVNEQLLSQFESALTAVGQALTLT